MRINDIVDVNRNGVVQSFKTIFIITSLRISYVFIRFGISYQLKNFPDLRNFCFIFVINTFNRFYAS